MSILTQGAKIIGRNAGKIIKGIKSSGPAIVKGIKSSGVSIGKGLKSGAGLLSRTASSAGGAISRGASATGGAVSSAGQTIRNTTSAAGTAIGKGVQKVKNLFKPKAQGVVVVEKVIKKGGPPKKPVLRTRIRQGNSTSDPNLGIKQIEKNVKKALAKKNAVKVVKKVKPQTVKPAVVKPQKGMAYI